MARKKVIIQRERQYATNRRKVKRALYEIACVFNERGLNFAEGLAVAKSIIVNAFVNKAEQAETDEELQALIDIAEEFLIKTSMNIADKIESL